MFIVNKNTDELVNLNKIELFTCSTDCVTMGPNGFAVVGKSKNGIWWEFSNPTNSDDAHTDFFVLKEHLKANNLLIEL